MLKYYEYEIHAQKIGDYLKVLVLMRFFRMCSV